MSGPPWLVPRAAYVHVPFCAHHCGYCDFAVVVGQDERVGAYLDGLERELAFQGCPRPVETLFIGGGTPSHLPLPHLRRLLGMLAHWLPMTEGGEYTIEANPDSLTAEKVAVLAERGVNRVSLGAQSFDQEALAVLERQHAVDEVAAAVQRVRGKIAQVSLDLIFGVPGQTLSGWRRDMATALSLNPDHLSTYGLTYEKGTRLWKQRRAGRLVPLGEEEELHLYEAAIDTLEGAGMEHYEVSNFAHPGRRSRHNQVYWANHAYYGFGLGAARYVMGRREVNTRDLGLYLRRLQAGQNPTQQGEELPPLERGRETMAMQLRRADGINRTAFAEQTGFSLEEVAGEKLPPLVEQGLLVDAGEAVYLSRRGRYVADGVIERLL